MKKAQLKIIPESLQPPHYVRNLSPQIITLLEQHFWCDFSDINPALAWEKDQTPN